MGSVTTHPTNTNTNTKETTTMTTYRTSDALDFRLAAYDYFAALVALDRAAERVDIMAHYDLQTVPPGEERDELNTVVELIAGTGQALSAATAHMRDALPPGWEDTVDGIVDFGPLDELVDPEDAA